MNALQQVAKLKLTETNNEILNNIAGLASDAKNFELQAFFTNEIKNCDDVELLRAVSIEFYDNSVFSELEDRLCELVGDDEHFDWVDENIEE